MIPASLLTHVPPARIPSPPPAPVIALPDVTAGLGGVLPLDAWPNGYTEGPCDAELGAIRLHRDGRCCRCSAPRTDR